MDPFVKAHERAGELRTIQSQLPYVFKRGSQLSEFDAHCSCCRQKLDVNMVRGFVVPLSDRMIQVRALGHCQACDKFSKFDYRVDDELTIIGQDSKGKWQRWAAKKASWISRNLVPMLAGVATFMLLCYEYGFP